jgi:hypothetical protein
MKPAAMEPNPSKPRSGSGEAVWGSFWLASALVFWSAAAELSAAAGALSAAVAFWSVPVVLLAGGFCAVVLLAEEALWSEVLDVLGVCVGEFTGALALSDDAPAGLLVVAAGAFALLEGVLLVAEAFWSEVLDVLGVCAGGFTGALALSDDAPAGLLVVAAGAFALLESVVGVVLLAEDWLAAL